MSKEDFIYELPGANMTVTDALFNKPMEYTGGGFYLNAWLMTFGGILFIGALQYGHDGKKSSLYATFAVFMITFILTLAEVAGGNQLIPALVALIASVAVNYLDKGGAM